jgi:transposase
LNRKQRCNIYFRFPKDARNNSGLWWGNYNAVCDSYESARGRALKTGAELRFHRFDGSGRFKNQIQGGMSVTELFSGAQSQVQVKAVSDAAFHHPVRGERRRYQRTELTITIFMRGGIRRTLTFPMVMHREIPADAAIKEVVVTRKRVGTRYEWSVSFLCTRAAEASKPMHHSPSVCGVDLGWRKRPDGLRVATVVGSDGTEPHHVVLPTETLAQFEYVDQLQAQLDERLNTMWKTFKEWSFDDAPEALVNALPKRVAKPAAGKLAQLAIRWRDYPLYRQEWFSALEVWRKRDKRKRLELGNLRGKIIRRRRELYRIEAKKLAECYAVIALEDFDLRTVALLERPDGTENVLPAPARRHRQIACVSELRNWIALQAAKAGAEIILSSGASTTACQHCGAVNLPPDRAALTWACDSCHAVWDQDANAAANLCGVARGVPMPAQRLCS